MAVQAIGGWLVSLAVPILKRILVALGVGILSYAGLAALGAQVQSAVVSAWGQMGGSTLQILSLAGFPQAVGIVLGALSARLALITLSRIGRVAS